MRCAIQLCLVTAVLVLLSGNAQAVSVGTVPVGNVGNTADINTTFGAIAYDYNIGTYEVTAAQYTEFLNAVADTDTYGLYNPSMTVVDDGDPETAPQTGCDIQQSGSPGSYAYSVAVDRANRPVNFVSWGDAARFANWMYNGQPTGAQGPGTTETGSYSLSGAISDAALQLVTREASATWVIPTEDEWYKAAYHKNNGNTGDYWTYPTQSDSYPGRDLADVSGNNSNHYGLPYPIESPYYTNTVGDFQLSDSPYGTFDQGGNVFEWNEALLTDTNPGDARGIRGGGFGSGDNQTTLDQNALLPSTERSDIGFRLVQLDTVPIPEPSSLSLLATALIGLLAGARRKRK